MTLHGLQMRPSVSHVQIQVDEDRSGAIDFKEFLTVFEKQKASAVVDVDEDITLEAFVALGGQVRRSYSCIVSQSPPPQIHTR